MDPILKPAAAVIDQHQNIPSSSNSFMTPSSSSTSSQKLRPSTTTTTNSSASSTTTATTKVKTTTSSSSSINSPSPSATATSTATIKPSLTTATIPIDTDSIHIPTDPDLILAGSVYHDSKNHPFIVRTPSFDLPLQVQGQAQAIHPSHHPTPSIDHPSYAQQEARHQVHPIHEKKFVLPNLDRPVKRKQFEPSSIGNPANLNEIQIKDHHHQSSIDAKLINVDHLSPEPELSPQQLKKLTTEKRKAQNRAAQRNFRERKEKQSKLNEQNLVIRTEENKKMRELIKSLEAENTLLRQHVSDAVIQQLEKTFPSRPPLSSIVVPISAYDEFLGSPEKTLSESEEHARAATALSSLAAAPLEPVFDPQLQELGPSKPYLTSSQDATSPIDLIVPSRDNTHAFNSESLIPTHRSIQLS